MEQEIKTDIDLKTLPQFEFITELPIQSLVITSDEELYEAKAGTRIVELLAKEADDRVGDGRKRVRLTASSNATDLVGDVMSKNALHQMKNAAVGTTIFLNHDATVPESVFGAVEKAELVTKAFEILEENGKKATLNLLCLEYDVIVEETSDRAVNVWKMIDAGTTKLGASVTIAIIEKSSLSGGRRCIDDVIYLETSIVGIPCNQTAWVNHVKSKGWIQMAAKSLRKIEHAEKKSPAVPLEVIAVETADIDAVLQPRVIVEMAVDAVTAAAIGEGAERVLLKTTKRGHNALKSMLNGTKVEKEKSMKITEAKSAAEVLAAFKDLFTDAVEEHYENPWLYCYLLEDAILELLYCNSTLDAESKLTAAGEMFDAFKGKMLEILGMYFDDDEEKSADTKASFNKGMATHMQRIMKEGRRNNKSDAQLHQAIHDLAVSLDAKCVTEKDADLGTDGTAVSTEAISVELEAVRTELEASKAAEAVAVAKITALENETKKLKLQISKWKAGATTAVAMLDRHLDVPAPQPGSIAS